MSRLRATDKVRIDLGDGEEAWIPAQMPPGVGMEASAILAKAPDYASEQEIQRDLNLAFVRAVESWSLELPVSKVLELEWATLARIANAVSEQYIEEVLAPFRVALQESSQRGQTEASTSPTPPSTEASPEP